LRKALRWETMKLFAFGGAEIFDVVSDWVSIFKMRKEFVKLERTKFTPVYIYAFLGGCSLFVAIYALMQRAAIQGTVNEQVHNDFVSSLQQGEQIKEARGQHFTSKRRSSIATSREGRSVRERSVKEGSEKVRERAPPCPERPAEGDRPVALSPLFVLTVYGPSHSHTAFVRTVFLPLVHTRVWLTLTVYVCLAQEMTPKMAEIINKGATQGMGGSGDLGSIEAGETKVLDKKAITMAKEYAVIERQMLLHQISVMLLFVEDIPSIILNCVVYIPLGNVPLESILSCGVSLMVIGYKVSLFGKLKLMQKREEDIETFFKTLSENQMKDAKLRIMEELQSSQQKEKDAMLRRKNEGRRRERERLQNSSGGDSLRGAARGVLGKGMSFRIGGKLSNPKMREEKEEGGGLSPKGSASNGGGKRSLFNSLKAVAPMMSPPSSEGEDKSTGSRRSMAESFKRAFSVKRGAGVRGAVPGLNSQRESEPTAVVPGLPSGIAQADMATSRG